MEVRCDTCGRVYDDFDCWTICPHSPLGYPHDDLCPKCDTLKSVHGPCVHQVTLPPVADGTVGAPVLEFSVAELLAQTEGHHDSCACGACLALASRAEAEEERDGPLHARCAHPAYEYETTEGPRKGWDDETRPPDGDATWQRNRFKGRHGWERFANTEEAYWMRPKMCQVCGGRGEHVPGCCCGFGCDAPPVQRTPTTTTAFETVPGKFEFTPPVERLGCPISPEQQVDAGLAETAKRNSLPPGSFTQKIIDESSGPEPRPKPLLVFEGSPYHHGMAYVPAAAAVVGLLRVAVAKGLVTVEELEASYQEAMRCDVPITFHPDGRISGLAVRPPIPASAEAECRWVWCYTVKAWLAEPRQGCPCEGCRLKVST